MTSTISESAKAKDRNYYYHKSETEFDEWTPRIQALAGKAKVKRMMVLGEHDNADVRKKDNKDEDKVQAMIDAGNTAFDLLIEHIACAKQRHPDGAAVEVMLLGPGERESNEWGPARVKSMDGGVLG